MLKDFITEKGIQSIKHHKYVGGAYTSLDNKMNKFWTALLDYMPTFISPNLITFIGNFSYIFSVLLLMKDGSDFELEKPRFNYFLCGLVMLFYQTMDALDGKQARRLGKSTPLGQLVDHGSDCITATFIMYNVLSCFRIENDNVIVMLCSFMMVLTFYYANWAEYFTGVLVTANNNIGVTEIEFIITIFNWLTAIFGSSLWHISIFGNLIRHQTLFHHNNDSVLVWNNKLSRYPKRCLL